MPKQTFTLNDFSGGVNGYIDPLDIADNELAQCQGFKPEPGTVSILGDMKGAYVPPSANGSDVIAIEPGYGIFAFAHDYDKDGDLNTTKYLVLMDNVTFDIYDDDGDVWQTSRFNLGTVASNASFSESVKPCFFIADGALRVSPGNFAKKDSGENMNAQIIGETNYGGFDAVTLAVDDTEYLTAGDTVVVGGTAGGGGVECIAFNAPNSASGYYFGRNMTGTFTAATGSSTANKIIYVVLDTRWHGIVKRRNFSDVTAIGTFTEWYQSFAHPRPPVTYHASIDYDDVVPDYTYPFLVKHDSGTITIDGEQSPCLHVGFAEDTDNPDGTWDGAVVNLYTTALYDEAKQESQPNKYATNITVEAAKEFAIWIGVEHSDDGSAYRIHKRVTGARVYYEDTTNDPGILFQLVEIDFEKGCKKADAETFSVWSNATVTGGIGAGDTDKCCECPYFDSSGALEAQRTGANAFIFVSPPKAFTYEINTLYPPDVNTHARYKTAVVANRRLFVGNVYQSGKANGDRMICSPVNKFDLLPEYGDHVVDVTKGDGDEIVKLEAYADRILQFKKRTLYIINIGGGLGEEFLESQHRNMGVENPSQTCMTEYGVAWVNSHGVFLYDGQEITDLTLNKLQMTNTTTADRPRALNIVESKVPLIGYHPDNKWLVVQTAGDASGSFEVEAWIHDFKNGSWTYSQEFNTDTHHKSNMIWTPDNNLIVASGTNSSFNPLFYKYRDSSANVASGNLLFLTKDFHLDAPGVKKKLRSVYITYSAAANTKIEADIIYKHVTGETTTEESLVEANSGSTYYTNANGFLSTEGSLAAPNIRTVELVPTTPVTNAYTFQLKLHAPDADYVYTSYFKLYNVSFVYRPLGVR